MQCERIKLQLRQSVEEAISAILNTTLQRGFVPMKDGYYEFDVSKRGLGMIDISFYNCNNVFVWAQQVPFSTADWVGLLIQRTR